MTGRLLSDDASAKRMDLAHAKAEAELISGSICNRVISK